MISPELIEQAISVLADVEGVYFDARHLVQDVVGVSSAFPDEGEFQAAIASTVRKLAQIASGKVSTSQLEDDYSEWECCHYQHKAGQGEKADMRIMFARASGTVRVRGFGDRRLPDDFYRRMAQIGCIDPRA